MSDIDPDVLSIMASASFDTCEQMEAAYHVGSAALTLIKAGIYRKAADIAYDAVDKHLWDASVAGAVRSSIVDAALSPTVETPR